MSQKETIWLGTGLFVQNGEKGNVVVKGEILKRIGIGKSSSVYKSSNKLEKCLMGFAGKRLM
jgi:hypothetical protein